MMELLVLLKQSRPNNTDRDEDFSLFLLDVFKRDHVLTILKGFLEYAVKFLTLQ